MTKLLHILMVLLTISAFELQAQPEEFKKEYTALEGLARVEAIRDHVYKHQNDTGSYLFPLAEEALRMCEKQGFEKEETTMLRLLGSLSRRRGKMDSALSILNHALELAESRDLQDEAYEILGVRGAVFSNLQDFEQSIADYIATLDYLEKSGKFYSLGYRLSGIGNAYLYLDMVDNGLKYNKLALEVDTVKEIPWMLSRIYNSMGYAYDELSKYDSALIYYEKTYELAREQADSGRMAMAMVNSCSALEAQGNYKAAESYLNETNAFLIKTGQEDYCVHTYSTLANLYLKTNRGDQALNSIEQLRRYLGLYPDELVRLQLPAMLSEAFEKSGQPDSALKYQKIHAQLQDSVSGASKLEQIEELRLAYETEKKDEQIKASERENALKDERNKRTQILWMISVIALLLFSGFVYMSINRRLLKKKNELAEGAAQHKQALLKAAVNAQEDERKRIAQELHDGIGQQFTAIKLAYESSKERDVESTNMNELIEQAADDVRTLSHQMMPRVLREVGLTSALTDLVDSLNVSVKTKVSLDSRNMDERFPESIEINYFRIAQELLNNALKHAEASEINLMIYQADGQLIMMMDDNGKGVDLSTAKGHGLTSMQSRAEAIGATLQFESARGEGFMAQVKLRLSEFRWA